TGQPPTTKRPAKAPVKPRRKRVSQARPGSAGNWRLRGTVLRQRLAQWFIWTRRERLRMSLRELQAAAHADDVTLSVTTIQRIESLIDPTLASERSWIAIDYVLWLAAYSGQSLMDVDRFITSGDWRYIGRLDADGVTNEDHQADRVRVGFLGLSHQRRQEVLEFIDFARSRDERDQAAALGLRERTPPTPPPAATPPGIDAGTQQVLDDVAGVTHELREELRRHQDQQPGQRPHKEKRQHN
ncbi:MAG TPA: hypothetical protein VE338_13085, partial [Ktedonobacterales bacterium]|nr:hypothetical protein [Ktedonobacterales bacterium]